MVVELISVGTELLMGNILNTNAKFLSEQCAGLGLSVYYQVTVGDNRQRLKETITTALSRSDILILSGGLGPTEDDLTKETVAEVLSKPLVEDAHCREQLEKYFNNGIYKNITPNNWKQTVIMEGCTVFDNANGTAPGLMTEDENGKKIILLPGPPNELVPMFKNQVAPVLASMQEGILYSEMVKVVGIGESQAETMIKDLIDSQTNPTIAPYAKTGEVHFRITALAQSTEEGKKLVEPVYAELEKRFGSNIYTNKEDETLEDHIIWLLKDKNYKITTAESCTGGLLAGRLVNVPGASSVFTEGHITYANAAKEKYLKVPHEILEQFGAVSEETAKAMAEGAAELAGCECALAVTGIAGPDGGTEEKMAGTVYIGCYVNGKIRVKHYVFRGSRNKVREYSVQCALDLLRRCIIGE